MNYEKRYLIQKKRADSLEKLNTDLETQITILRKENNVLNEQQKTYLGAIEAAEKAKAEYTKLIEETKHIKSKYKIALREFNEVKKKYLSDIKKLHKQISNRIGG